MATASRPDHRNPGGSLPGRLPAAALVLSILLCAAAARSVAADDRALGTEPALTQSEVPFPATVRSGSAWVRLRPESDAPKVGLLHEGAKVTVTSCQPDCTASQAWALLGTNGAIKLALLQPQGERRAAVPAHAAPSAAVQWYGRVGPSGIRIYKAPRLDARLLTRARMRRELVFSPDVALRDRGWLERLEGGFVRLGRVEMLTPSSFHGDAKPQLPFAFVTRSVRAPDDKRGPRLQRYQRLPVLAIEGRRVMTSRGSLPAGALRVVALRSPPPGLPPDARWVHVNLAEQTLTAYEGPVPVFATLVSTGKDGKERRSHSGLFQVAHKMLTSDMHGEPDDPYEVERVPHALYYFKNEALHGAYWHDRFGHPASHGCVNLSVADARWIFDWAPPKLPEGWSSIEPKVAGLTSLWVLVERDAALPMTRSAAVIAARPPAPVAPTIRLIIPVQGVTRNQLVDTYQAARSGGRVHDAIDIMAPHNTPVLAAAPGRILKLFQSDRGGVTVNVLGEDGTTLYYYAHLDHYAEGLHDGQLLRRGEVIAFVGDTGNAGHANYHHHFGVWRIASVARYWEGENMNPYVLLRQ